MSLETKTHFKKNSIKKNESKALLILQFPRIILMLDSFLTTATDAQYSKIGKKCNFKSTKTHFLLFQKWQKINFCTRKKFKTTKNAI